MHLLVTDHLRCPRCGPKFGVILLAHRIDDRRVEQGALGCANCRASYPIERFEVDLGLQAAGDDTGERVPSRAGTGGEEERALRIAALLGLAGATGFVLLEGASPDVAEGVKALVPDVELVVVDAAGDLPPRPRFTALRLGDGWPLADRSLSGAALASPRRLEEVARALAPGRRVVLEGADDTAPERLAAAGLRTLVRDGGVVVAERIS